MIAYKIYEIFDLPYQPTSRSQAAIIIKDSTIVTFSNIKIYLTKFDSVVNFGQCQLMVTI